MITLRCWHCGATTQADAPPPQFGYEMMAAAQNAGWKPKYDLKYNRVLIFCCDAHAIAQQTKTGNWRKYPKRTQEITHD